MNLGDFNLLAGNFGLSAAGSEVTPQDWANLAAAVPEPSALILTGVPALAGMWMRRRRVAPPRNSRETLRASNDILSLAHFYFLGGRIMRYSSLCAAFRRAACRCDFGPRTAPALFVETALPSGAAPDGFSPNGPGTILQSQIGATVPTVASPSHSMKWAVPVRARHSSAPR